MAPAYRSSAREEYFWPFSVLSIVLFSATSVGNGSIFRAITVVFDAEQAGPVLGWASAVAACGVLINPTVFGEQIEPVTHEYTLYGFVLFHWYASYSTAGSTCDPMHA